MRSRSFSAMLFCLASLTATPAFAASPFWREVLQFERAPTSHQYFVVGVILLLVALVAYGRFGSSLLVGTFVSVGSLCLITAVGMRISNKVHQRGWKDQTALAAVTQPLGGNCSINADCDAGLLCAAVKGKSRCWAPCATDQACPDGYTCIATKTGAHVCAQ